MRKCSSTAQNTAWKPGSKAWNSRAEFLSLECKCEPDTREFRGNNFDLVYAKKVCGQKHGTSTSNMVQTP